jgi:acyl dehydratase
MGQKTSVQGVDGLKALVGQPLGTSEWRTMRFEDIVGFAELTGDRQWIHTDRARAERESPYGAPIAHGYFSVSLIGGLFFEIVDVSGFKAIVNYGLNKVRFPTPLKADARYRLSLRLNEVKDINGGVEGTMQATVEVEGEAKPACAAEMVFRFLA